MLSFIKEFISFLLQRKKFALIPLFLLLIVFGALMVGTQGSAIGPFVYALF